MKEAIQQKNDKVAKYNLSHIYIYEYQTEKFINESIKLLIESSNDGFSPSRELLFMILIQKHGLNIDKIEEEITNHTNNSHELVSYIFEQIEYHDFDDETSLHDLYHKYENIDFLYNTIFIPILSSSIIKKEIKEERTNENTGFEITSDFYEGFSIDN